MTPEGWSRRRMREFATRSRVINAEGELLPPLSITKGRGVVLQSDKYKKQIATDLRKYVIARRGQFAFDPMSLYYGAIGQVTSPEIGLVSPDYVVFDVDESVDKPFLNYLLRSPEQITVYEAVAETGNQFGKRRRVYWSVFEELELALPPLHEQRKIAAILSSVDDAIEATQAVIDQLQIARTSVMADLLARGAPGAHTHFRPTDHGMLPGTWAESTLGDVATVFNGRAAGTGGTWLRVFKTKHVYDGFVRLDVCEYAKDDSAAQVPAETYLRSGDVLAPNMAHGTIGRVAFVPDAGNRWATDGQVMVLRADGKKLNARYLFEFLSSERGRRQLLDLEKGGAFDTKRGQTHIYPRDVKNLWIAIPPLEEQAMIAGCATSFDEPLATNKMRLDELRVVKSGLLQSLLTGELRVTPDEAVT